MDLTLWPACVKTHAFAEQLRAAAEGGFDTLPIGPLTYKALRAAGMSGADICMLAADAGVRLGHYDGFSDWAPLRFSDALPAAAKAVFDFSTDECLRICTELELPAICATGAFVGGECELPALVDSFAAFCERARAAGVRVDLEFIPMWGVADLATAWEIVRGAASPNAGILFDTWHFFRGRPDLQLLDELPTGTVTTLQLADAQAHARSPDLFEDCLRYRMLPGLGELPVGSVLEILQRKGGLSSIGPEVFSDELDALEAVECGRRAGEATRRVLCKAGFDAPQPTVSNRTRKPL